MKIIRRGNDPANDVFKGTCSYCKTVFECQRHEGKYEDDFRETSGFLRVDCPVCGHKAVAYRSRDDQLIPEHERSRYTWDSTARQIADIEERGVIPR